MPLADYKALNGSTVQLVLRLRRLQITPGLRSKTANCSSNFPLTNNASSSPGIHPGVNLPVSLVECGQHDHLGGRVFRHHQQRRGEIRNHPSRPPSSESSDTIDNVKAKIQDGQLDSIEAKIHNLYPYLRQIQRLDPRDMFSTSTPRYQTRGVINVGCSREGHRDWNLAKFDREENQTATV